MAAPRKHPRKTMTMTGTDWKTTVTLSQKHGVWFVMKVEGFHSVNDFYAEYGWGITDHSVRRAASNLGASLEESPVELPVPVIPPEVVDIPIPAEI